MAFIDKIKSIIVHRLLSKLKAGFWTIDTQKEKEYCVFHKTIFWAEDMEAEKNQFKLQNRLPFFDFFVEMESSYHYNYNTLVLICPERGWLIDEKNKKLFSKSFPYYNNPFSGSIYYPRLRSYLNPFKKITELEQAISMPYGWNNYFHFFIETLPQMVMLNESIIDKNIPIIIPQQALSFPYVQEFLTLNHLVGQRKIILQQSNEYIRIIKHTHVFKDIGYPKASLFQILNSFNDTSFLSAQGNRKVYLKRATDKQREITNAGEVEQYLSDLGYEIIDAEKMSLVEQINLFSTTSKIIGIHGAGLTNILFRYGRSLDLIEIFPEGHAPEHYKILAAALGYSYRSITGSSFDAQKKFILPLEKLKSLKMV